MSAAEPSAIEVDGITQRYGKTTALDGVTLSFRSGSATALVGPDGVGKSTLLGLIAGVRRLQAGAIRTLGGDIASAAHRDRIMSRIAYMPQGLGRNLYPSLSVAENIDYFGRLFGLSPGARRAPAARHRAPSLSRPARRQALGRDEAEALALLRPHP
jgi:ribosome-dependent ATPase